MLAMQSDLRVYEDAKVISNLQHLLSSLNNMPKKEDLDKVLRELSRIKEELKSVKEDFMTVRDQVTSLEGHLADFEGEVNKDIGSLKGSCKWSEDQINMIKKMM